jgi:hypothetical protein
MYISRSFFCNFVRPKTIDKDFFRKGKIRSRLMYILVYNYLVLRKHRPIINKKVILEKEMLFQEYFLLIYCITKKYTAHNFCRSSTLFVSLIWKQLLVARVTARYLATSWTNALSVDRIIQV